MSTLSVTVKGQLTLKREFLQHLGIRPGERIDCEKLPGGALRLRSVQSTGDIEGFLGLLARKTQKVATIEEIGEAAAAGWAGQV